MWYWSLRNSVLAGYEDTQHRILTSIWGSLFTSSPTASMASLVPTPCVPQTVRWEVRNLKLWQIIERYPPRCPKSTWNWKNKTTISINATPWTLKAQGKAAYSKQHTNTFNHSIYKHMTEEHKTPLTMLLAWIGNRISSIDMHQAYYGQLQSLDPNHALVWDLNVQYSLPVLWGITSDRSWPEL